MLVTIIFYFSHDVDIVICKCFKLDKAKLFSSGIGKKRRNNGKKGFVHIL